MTTKICIRYDSGQDIKPGRAKLLLRWLYGVPSDSKGWSTHVEFEDGRKWTLDVSEGAPRNDVRLPVPIVFVRCPLRKPVGWTRRHKRHVRAWSKKLAIENCQEHVKPFADKDSGDGQIVGEFGAGEVGAGGANEVGTGEFDGGSNVGGSDSRAPVSSSFISKSRCTSHKLADRRRRRKHHAIKASKKSIIENFQKFIKLLRVLNADNDSDDGGTDATTDVGEIDGDSDDRGSDLKELVTFGSIQCSPRDLADWAAKRKNHVIKASKKSAIENCQELVELFADKNRNDSQMSGELDGETDGELNGKTDGETDVGNIGDDCDDGKRDLELFESDDTALRPARVSLYTSNLRYSPDKKCSSSPGLHALIAPMLPEGIQHWGVIVEFEDGGPTYTFDGNTRDGNYVNGEFVVWVTKGKPNQITNSEEPFGGIECSPKQLFALGRAMLATRRTYSFDASVGINCQEWAIAFSERLINTYGKKDEASPAARMFVQFPRQFREFVVEKAKWLFTMYIVVSPVVLFFVLIGLFLFSPSLFSKFVAYFNVEPPK